MISSNIANKKQFVTYPEVSAKMNYNSQDFSRLNLKPPIIRASVVKNCYKNKEINKKE